MDNKARIITMGIAIGIAISIEKIQKYIESIKEKSYADGYDTGWSDAVIADCLDLD